MNIIIFEILSFNFKKLKNWELKIIKVNGSDVLVIYWCASVSY